MSTLRAVKGMNDVLPADIHRWHRVEAAFWALAGRYGYREVRTPLVEPTPLFTRSIGEATDIVEKEMYTFVDKGDDRLTLRPEGTASAVRAYIQHRVDTKEPVTKWAYLGPMFRRERPARGRYRQFWQAGVEAYGDPGPHVDAEMIDMIYALLRGLGAQELEVLVNSLGSGDTRVKYRHALDAYFRPHVEALSADSQRRLELNPLRILDSKAPQDQELAAEAPQILDFLGEDDQAHFDELRRTLDALGTPYRVAPRLVRGLDYYSRTLFEVVGSGGELGAQNTLCGGGRYDGLVKTLGGPDVPAIGFAMGIERILLVLGETGEAPRLEAFVATSSPDLRARATVLLRDLRQAGLRADADLRGRSLKSQLRRANGMGARLAFVLGEDELARGSVQLKDLDGGSQDDVPLDGAVEAARARLQESA